MDPCPNCATMQTYSEQVLADFENSEREVRRLRRTVTRLENEAKEKARKQRDGVVLEELAAYWRTVCNHPRALVPLDGIRAEKAWARLTQEPKSFTLEQLKRACDGAGEFPYVGPGGRSRTGTAKQRFDDLELICRDEKTVERFIELADMADAERAAAAGEPEW